MEYFLCSRERNCEHDAIIFYFYFPNNAAEQVSYVPALGENVGKINEDLAKKVSITID